MKIPYVKAIDKDTNKEVKGFYFEYPSTTYCFSNEYNNCPVKLIPCIVFHQMTDWSMPNKPMLCTNIDKSTLELIGYIDTENDNYIPSEWIKHTEDNK